MTVWGGKRPGAGRKRGSANKPKDSSVIALPKKMGGARPNTGPKSGSGKYGEKTQTMRVPISMKGDLMRYIEHKGFSLPLYAMKVPMGMMKASIDYVERYLNLNDLIKHPADTFFHKVEGNSMEPTVFAGDLAMIDAKIEPMHGDVVLACIDGGLTLKRLMKMRGRVWLKADNPDVIPIKADENVENFINGVMLIAIRPVSLNHIKTF